MTHQTKTIMVNIQEIALDIITEQVSKTMRIEFNDDWFTFYFDGSGQRGHHIIPYIEGEHVIKNRYIVKRVLQFCNSVDIGTDGAILGVLKLDKCKALSIKADRIEFENFTIYLNNNHWTINKDL